MTEPKKVTPKKGWISFIVALISAIGGVLIEHFTNLIP